MSLGVAHLNPTGTQRWVPKGHICSKKCSLAHGPCSGPQFSYPSNQEKGHMYSKKGNILPAWISSWSTFPSLEHSFSVCMGVGFLRPSRLWGEPVVLCPTPASPLPHWCGHRAEQRLKSRALVKCRRDAWFHTFDQIIEPFYPQFPYI